MLAAYEYSAAISGSFFVYLVRSHRYLHSFPTRRSSDLSNMKISSTMPTTGTRLISSHHPERPVSCNRRTVTAIPGINTDRKSTRLNSSHVRISYAVFCLKKKTGEHHEVSSYARGI